MTWARRTTAGIDLGATNSRIAVTGPAGPEMVLNDDASASTRTAVAIGPAGETWIGRRAAQSAASDPDNAATGFTQLLGDLRWRKTFAASGRVLDPIDLSSLLIAELRRCAERRLGRRIDAVAITRPPTTGDGGPMACLAAAKLAGMDAVTLPAHAAAVYARDGATDRALWLVYSLRGAGFDAALVQAKGDGRTETLGDVVAPRLGSTGLDRDVVDRLLVPAVAEQLQLRNRRAVRAHPLHHANLATLEKAAEQLKIELDGARSASVDVELSRLDGTVCDVGATLTRAELDRIAQRRYRRSVRLCRAMLRAARIRPGAVDRLLLVGGATQDPALRDLLADGRHGLGIEIDASLDPITATATGAAVYAADRL